ncbi:MAG: Lrp/AsnC family transcriptional regulator [Dehalococcoidia bacterium]|jgi:Lrp/AsnC family transcriptional regulator for asnA, asnC and gidA
MKHIDDIDKKIVAALEKDASMSSRELAEALDICAPTVRRRVNRLIRDDIIRIQAVQINRARTSLTVAILLKVENNAISRTADLLTKQEEVGFLALAAGRFNMIMVCWFVTVEAYSKFLNTVLYTMNGVLETDTAICTEYRKYAFVNLSRAGGIVQTTGKPVDDIDLKIVSALEKDAHQSNTRLAKSLNMSSATIRRRINNLLSNNVIHIQAFPNVRLGKMITSVIALKVDNGALNRIADYFSDMDEVRQVLLTAGNYDIGVWAWFESIEAFSEFLNNRINSLEGVEKKTIIIMTEIRKWVHMW